MTTPVSAAYNFTLSGAGNYSVGPSNLFTYVDVNGTLKDLHANVEDIAEVRLSGDLVVSRVLDRREGLTVACSKDQYSELSTAIIAAYGLVRRAIIFIKDMDHENPPPRWITWFGVSPPCAMDWAPRVFQMILSFGFNNFNYDCRCDRPDLIFSSAYIFQSWNYCYSATDRSLDQVWNGRGGGYTSALDSGISPPPVPIPGQELLFMRLPTSMTWARPIITLLVGLLV